MKPKYYKLLQEIKKQIFEGGYDTKTNKPHKNVLRIGMSSYINLNFLCEKVAD